MSRGAAPTSVLLLLLLGFGLGADSQDPLADQGAKGVKALEGEVKGEERGRGMQGGAPQS